MVVQGRQRRKGFLIIFALLVGWRVQVIDEKGSVIPGAVVRQIWQDYSAETKGHEEREREFSTRIDALQKAGVTLPPTI